MMRLNVIKNHLRPSSLPLSPSSFSNLAAASSSFSSVRPSFSSAASATFKDDDVVILSAVRTPLGGFQGSLSSVSAVDLGVVAVKEALARSKLTSSAQEDEEKSQIDEMIMGNVCSANLGQAPVSQVSHYAGLSPSVSCTAVNKVCSSGLKSVILAYQSIKTDDKKKGIIAGGFESMSNIPFYLPKQRKGQSLGHTEVLDGLIRDGLWDNIENIHMGNIAEDCSKRYSFSREDNDKYAVESYRRATEAQRKGLFKEEIVPVPVKGKKGEELLIDEDEDPKKLVLSKVSQLKTVFLKNGTITAANASNINDGAAAVVLCSGKYAKEQKLTPLAKIIGFADAQRKPMDFPIAPSSAIPKALASAGLNKDQIDYWEINEAFSSVSLANNKILGLDPSKVNVNGGAIALGHPIGSSGCRIFVTLLSVLKQKQAKYGCAAICNGGGGASAIVVERL